MQKDNPSKGLILVTGGAGYVGSHTLVKLLELNYEAVVIDNCCNAIKCNKKFLPESLIQVEQITKKKLVKFIECDLLDEKELEKVFQAYKFDGVIHFAGLKAVGESCKIPITYYKTNVNGTLNLLIQMQKYNVKNLIFSSSCTVYGLPEYLPVDEQHKTGQNISNPYGRTKFVIEEILKDTVSADSELAVISLRYFNPIGAHESGLIGEDAQGIPNNLMPYILQVAIGRMPYLKIFGSDFRTIDGTGVRDYIHIMDLAWGHVLALDKMLEKKWKGFSPINLGTGSGYSVLQLVKAFEEANNLKIPFKIVERRCGDIDCVFSDSKKAKKELDWQAVYSIVDMCKHAWNWQLNNPLGFNLNKTDDVNNNKVNKEDHLKSINKNSLNQQIENNNDQTFINNNIY